MAAPLKVLCLDIEGGHGGSSRSLYYLLKHLDRTAVAPSVLCRRAGPIQDRYRDIGIPVALMPEMPKASALPRLSRNLIQLAGHAREFVQARGALARLAEQAGGYDVVHFNHEGLAGLAWWLRRRCGRPQTMHIRTNVMPSAVARAQMRIISRAVDAVAFITANEERTFRSLGGTAPGRVIYNVVEPGGDAAPHPDVPRDGRLVVASLSNAAHIRGTDRLLDVAEALLRAGRRDVLIVVAGDMRLAGGWPEPLAGVARAGGTLVDVVRQRGLQDFFLFLGHVPDPERVLAASDLLIKPTRHDDPWGRDILEALAAGKPVLSVGRDQTIVETGVTGFLQLEVDAAQLAREIVGIAEDRARLVRLSAAARQRVALLCDGTARARDLAQLWIEAAAA